MISGRLKDLLTVRTTAIAHQAAPASDSAARREKTHHPLQSDLAMIFQAYVVRCIVATDRKGCAEWFT